MISNIQGTGFGDESVYDSDSSVSSLLSQLDRLGLSPPCNLLTEKNNKNIYENNKNNKNDINDKNNKNNKNNENNENNEHFNKKRQVS